MDIKIRKAKPNEWEHVISIYREEGLDEDVNLVTQEVPKEFGEIAKNRVIYFAVSDKKVRGVIQLVFQQGDLADGVTTAMIHHLRVSKDFQGQGIGSMLIKKAEDEAKARKYTQITLEVEKTNIHAKKIYEHLGYQFFKDGNDPKEIVMIKKILL